MSSRRWRGGAQTRPSKSGRARFEARSTSSPHARAVVEKVDACAMQPAWRRTTMSAELARAHQSRYGTAREWPMACARSSSVLSPRWSMRCATDRVPMKSTLSVSRCRRNVARCFRTSDDSDETNTGHGSWPRQRLVTARSSPAQQALTTLDRSQARVSSRVIDPLLALSFIGVLV